MAGRDRGGLNNEPVTATGRERDMRCAEVRAALPAYEAQEHAPSMRRHLTGCHACRTQLERYEMLATGLRDLAAAPLEPPTGLLPALVAIPAENNFRGVRGHVVRNRLAYAGGLAVAAAGITGAALLRGRTRRLAAA